MKIINCVEEFKGVCEYLEDYKILEKLMEIPPKLMKFIIHNESIYI